VLTFKEIFPKWTDFKQFIIDYSIYYPANTYDDAKILIYYTLLYRNFANSHTAYDNEIFNEMLSLTIAENFREFFIIRNLLDLVASKNVNDLIVGIESINNVAENPNIDTNKDSIINYVGVQTRSTSKENIVDRVYALIPKITIPEIKNEIQKYGYLFLKIIPRTEWLFEEDEDETE